VKLRLSTGCLNIVRPVLLLFSEKIIKLKTLRCSVDLKHIAILEPQAGGACRAGNYYDLIIQCVKKSGHKIPVLSLNFRGEKSHPGFKINPKMLFGALAAVCYFLKSSVKCIPEQISIQSNMITSSLKHLGRAGYCLHCRKLFGCCQPSYRSVRLISLPYKIII